MTTDTRSADVNGVLERRRVFVNYLYGLHARLNSEDRWRAAEARQVLARLRRSFAGPRQQAEAYDVVFAHDPPASEQEVWLLIAGLFAIHPHPRPREPRQRSVGGAMGALARKRGASVHRRFVQLITVENTALAYHLRQAVQLLRTEDIRLDYQRLLDDLLVLQRNSTRTDAAHRVRLTWTREFHQAQHSTSSATERPLPETT